MIGAHRRLCQLLAVWRSGPNTSLCCRTFSSASSSPDPLDIHRKKLFLWFSHLSKEEKQFGGSFRPETMHVDPLILERRDEERSGLLKSPFQTNSPSSPPMTVEQLFHRADNWTPDLGLNVLLYGAVGSGKDTVVRKLVLDWCCGASLTQFKLLLPFSCKDLSQLSKAASLREIVARKYLHLRNHPLLSGNEDQAKEVLFLFNGMEKMHLDFRIGSTELCSDPGEALPAAGVVVNLLRKYLLPEASVLVTTRLSALDRIPSKYVSRYAQICGFSDPDHQRAYFSSRLLQQTGTDAPNREAEILVEQLYLNVQKKGQLATACFLPSYCWLTCATLHFLRFTSARAPVCTLTGIYSSFLTLNFGGEVLDSKPGKSLPSQEQHISLMLYVVRTLGKLAFDGVRYKRRSFSEKELEQWIGGKTKTDEELRLLAIFQTDVLNFFLEPCVENDKHLSNELGEDEGRWYVFAVPAMQEYLAALYVVLGENKSALELLSKEFSAAIGQASEDVNALFNILSKFIPLRIFAVFNLLKLFPKFFEKISRHNKGKIAWTMTAAMFRAEDSNNDDVLEQVEQSLLGFHGPAPQNYSKGRPFELYPVFMGGLLHYGNRVLLQQLGCNIQSSTVAQITRTLRKYLVKELSKPLPPDEQMDLLVLLYEIQNPRLTAEVLSSIRSICLAGVCMTSLKCFILSFVLSCTSTSYFLDKLDLSSCLLNHDLLQMLWPALKRVRQLNLQFNNLGPNSCILLRDLLVHPKASVSSLQLCGNLLQDSGCCSLLEALPENQTLQHLSLVHTNLGDHGAQQLTTRLQQLSGLQELNVAYNNVGDEAAVALVEACRDHPSIHTVHLYLNPLSDAGKKSLYVRGENKKKGQRVRVLASVTEGSDVSEEWHPILSVIRENASTWDSKHVKEQLEVFLRDLEWGRQQQPSFWKRLYFRKVERGVREIMQMVEEDTLAASKGYTK